MIAEAKAFWDAIAGKVKSLIRTETENAMRMQRYDVTTAPNGTVMGVTQPFGSTEIFLPYSQEVANAMVGDTVLVAWWGSMSNARVYYYAKGYDGGGGGGGGGAVTSVDGKTGAVHVLPTGGTTKQPLVKRSNTNYDVEWTTLTASDVGALPDTTPLPVTSGTGDRSIISVSPSNPNVASATVSIALGQDNTASGIGAVSIGTKVSGQSGNTSSGNGSVAIGSSLTASGNYAVALGTLNTSSAQAALTVGRESTANASFSSAIGLRNIASGAGSFVIGARNEEDTNALDATRGITGARKYILIVGNGTADDARSNAMTVDWDGNEVLAGKLTLGAAPTANMDATNKQYVDGAISGLTAADVGAVSTSDAKYKIYNTVSDLGLTPGSATIAGALSAMPDYSILIADGNDFSPWPEVPSRIGVVQIVRNYGSTRSYILFYGKEQSIRDYRMFCDSGGTPTGVWAPTFPTAPTAATVTMAAANWTGSGPYTQTVTATGATVTSSSKVDIQPDTTAINQLVTDGVTALYIVNNAGTLTATAIGAAPTANLTVQVTVTEVS